MKEQILSLLTAQNIAVAVGVLVSVLGFFLGSSELRRRRVALAVFHAFHIAEDIANETPGEDAFDKVAAGLKAADDYMKANGWRALKPGEAEVAKLQFKSMNAAVNMAGPILPQ